MPTLRALAAHTSWTLATEGLSGCKTRVQSPIWCFGRFLERADFVGVKLLSSSHFPVGFHSRVTRQLLRLGNLGRTHSLGQRITKLGCISCIFACETEPHICAHIILRHTLSLRI